MTAIREVRMVLEPNNTLDSPASLNLVHGFDEVVDQLRNMMGSLQSRVSSLTNNLRVASEVSTQIATILDLEQLLPITVDTVKERFGLYHVHIYLYDPFTNMLVMKAGSGEAGKMMRSAKHQIPLDAEKSLVARAARNDQAEVIMDVLQEPNYFQIKNTFWFTEGILKLKETNITYVAGYVLVYLM